MNYTLLEIVQDILSSLDGDEINSISDTVESQQVVICIKTVYDDIVSRTELPIQKTLFNLDASGTSTKPVLMTKPSTINHIEWLRYNGIETGGTDPVWKDLIPVPLDTFILQTQGLRPSETEVESFSHTVNGFTMTFHYRNDTSPTYYTTFNDNTLIFDSYDVAVDTTLQSSKTLGYGERAATFSNSDSWVPNLQPHQFPLLVNEAKSLAWVELRQMENPKAEKTARRNWAHLAAKRRHVLPNSHDGPDYGRKTTITNIPRALRSGS